jgi:hypothetical protein
LVKQFREAGAVTLETMFGVLCLYLLIGLMFAVSYGAIDEVSDTSFFTNGSTQRDDHLYFSYSTLSTVGYGDLTAATNLGRSLAITEALVGQLYLVTVVAVIVSNLARAADRGGPIRTASMLGEKAVRASVYSGASTSSRQKA